MARIRIRLLLFSVLAGSILYLSPLARGTCSGENDMTAVVSHVLDGDTFDVVSGDRIRLADVDAPEHYEEGYSGARDFLISLVQNKTVYLDIDDIHRKDQYDRLVCVVYVDYNSSHVMNVNKALLEEEVAVVKNYTDNEFDPYTWNLYCPGEIIPELPSFLVLPLFMIVTLLAVILCRRREI